MGPSYTTQQQGSFDAKARSDLNFQLYASDGTSQLSFVDVSDIGEVETLSGFNLEPGQYYIRVDGENDRNQFYQLEVEVFLTTPEDLTWVGRFGNAWDNQATDNFTAGSGFTSFSNFDNVTFNDSSFESFVIIPADISAGTIVVNAAIDYTFSGNGGIVDGSLAIEGSGSLELANTGNTYPGTTTVNSGTLIVTSSTGSGTTTVAQGAVLTGGGTVSGDLENAGELQPGSSVATLTVLGNATLEPTSTLSIEIGNSSNDLLHVDGILSLAGELSVNLVDGFAPSAGESFDILNFGSVFGEFDSFDFPELALGLFWDTSSLATTGELAVAAGLQGDFDLDNDVDGSDLLIWQRGYGTPTGASVSDGDADLDGDVDGDDLALWQANYGMTISLPLMNVPEPASSCLALLGILSLYGATDRGCRHEQ